MNQDFYFKNAKWVGAKERDADTFSILRGRFYVEMYERVTLNVLGLGFFKCYINGICINPDTFLPLSSEYEASCEPKDEVLTGHRVYVPQFDITNYVKVGNNVIVMQYGGGWYTHHARTFGKPKAIYCIDVACGGKTESFVSDEKCKIGPGSVTACRFVRFEERGATEREAALSYDFDDSNWENAVITERLETEYCVTDCPVDTYIETLPVKKVGNCYDCGKNTTGVPVIRINAEKGETITVRFSEEILPNGELDLTHQHSQRFIVVSDGTRREVQPEFTWFGFRYFDIEGDAEAVCVKVIHSDVPVTSHFECDNETLNWIYKTFIHTMLCNLHSGHPSDCPHLERRGYTGDGQLTAHAVFSVLDAEKIYKKWVQDICDGQDLKSGHIQYTAPYIRSGGGPGGWGCAMVEVPYQLYKHFGNIEYLGKYYGNMRRYIDYLEAHSEFGLVTSDKEGEWCLGDWCGPNILYPDRDITFHNQQVMLPAPMVNTYFMVKSLQQMCEIAKWIGKEEDISEYEEKIALRKRAITAAYFNTFDGNFVMNVQGANAYAVDLGLGNEKTYENVVDYYTKLGCFDTGIFATDILVRILFEHGNAELAVDLLMNNGAQGYEHWRQIGATTFHEYWDSNRSRSHNHPMFGAPVAYFFEYLLGIKQDKESAGYHSVTIAPMAVSKFRYMKGSMRVPKGEIAVAYEKVGEKVKFDIVIPANVCAKFQYLEQELELKEGRNTFVI
ncbi:MAG: family 78 glycoside hydrolase catalytic domain [Lachnospiraceae bacterium]|nr:family 78 glycoside hydrolase catalytic domain [Lachnospiraceae bacterium]